jgi:hypothetical protein
VEERERACDEEVLAQGNEGQDYAEGIVNVCKFYRESTLPCVSGVSGSDLKKRIEAIMTSRISHRLTPARKLLLWTAGLAALFGPFLIGLLYFPRGHAQSATEKLTFEVASIRPTDPERQSSVAPSGAVMIRVGLGPTPDGGLRASNVKLKTLIRYAYNLPCHGENCDALISGGPAWVDRDPFDILAKGPGAAEAGAGSSQMTPSHRRVFDE